MRIWTRFAVLLSSVIRSVCHQVSALPLAFSVTWSVRWDHPGIRIYNIEYRQLLRSPPTVCTLSTGTEPSKSAILWTSLLGLCPLGLHLEPQQISSSVLP